MLFGVHVYARGKVVPDLALSRGEEAHRAARLQGDRSIEFLAAGGMTLTLLELGDIVAAERWLGLAAAAASAAPSRYRARQLEMWRGMVRAAASDVETALVHLEAAVAIASEGGPASARCEALGRLALEAAAFATGDDDDPIAGLVERSAASAKDLLALLPGHPTWGAQADAALASVALARGDPTAAAMSAGAAFAALQAALHEDASLDIVIPAARALFAGGPPDAQEAVRDHLRTTLLRIAQGIGDEDIRVRWLAGPVGRPLVELAGAEGSATVAGERVEGRNATEGLEEIDRRLLQLLTQGRTNAQIAEELELAEVVVAQRLAGLQAQIGASSRADATSLAFRGLAAVGSH